MTLTAQIITLILVVAATQLCRWLPFWVFRSASSTPQIVYYLGRVLPSAVFAMLVVYCYKDVDFTSTPFGVAELVCGAVVAVLQYRFKSLALSMVAGTLLYILWVN